MCDSSVPLTMLSVNFVEALIIASIFFNLSPDTSSFYNRGAVLFMMVLLAGFGSMMEIMSLYEKRNIIEKVSAVLTPTGASSRTKLTILQHNRYALYRPSAEAVASMIVDMPYKITNALLVNSTLYFMANLRREAGPFFFFLLVSFAMTLSMSMFFRFFASITKTIAQALAPSGTYIHRYRIVDLH